MTETNETTALSAPEHRITLEAAAKKLGVAKRTVERICQLGMLKTSKGKPKGARQVTRLVDPAEVTVLKQDLKSGKVSIEYPHKNSVSRRVAEQVATAPQLPTLTGISHDPWLTIDEAASYSRLPVGYLRRCVDDKELPARNVIKSTRVNSWRIKRSAIDALDPAEKAYYRAPVVDRDVELGIISGD